MTTLRDNHIKMAKDFVEAGLLDNFGSNKWYMVGNNVSLSPTSPDFDKNANEVMRRWKGTISYNKWRNQNPVLSYWDHERQFELLTTPEKWLVMIYEQIKEEKDDGNRN